MTATDDHWAANSDLYRILGEDEIERLGSPEPDFWAWVDDLKMWIFAGVAMFAGLNIAAALIVKAGMWAGWW
jgi:hypothetical protein